MKLANDLLRNIGALSRSIQSFMDMKFRSYGLQRGQFIFVTRICESPGICQADLTAACNVDKGTTAKAVKKLEDAGLVSRRRDDTDKRMWHLFPTETGSALYEGLIEEENRQITAGLRGFTPEETRDLLLLVKKLQGNIQLGWQKQH